MVNPNVIQSDAVTVGYISHVLEGIFLWELITTANFEWNYVTAKRKFKWPLLVYSTCRICTLGGVICNFIVSGVTHKIDCQQWSTWNLIFLCASLACASLLITIRVIAIWSYNYIVTAVTIGMCITNVGFLLYGVVTLRSEWSNVSKSCILKNTFNGRYNITVTAVTDIVQLIIMFIGLLRSRQERHGFLHYLYIQGFIWLGAATLVETPSAVLIDLNLIDPWSIVFQSFSFYTMIICATRMYRGLIVYDMDVHKHSHGPNVTSSFRIGAQSSKGMAAGAGMAAPSTDRFDASFPRAKKLGNQSGRESGVRPRRRSSITHSSKPT